MRVETSSPHFSKLLLFTSRKMFLLRVTGFGLIIILKLITVHFGEELLHCRDFLNPYQVFVNETST